MKAKKLIKPLIDNKSYIATGNPVRKLECWGDAPNDPLFWFTGQ